MAQDTLDLGLIIQGRKARRREWRNGEYIFIQEGTRLDAINKDGKEGPVIINDRIGKRLADGTFGVFVPTQRELLAHDWTYMDEAPAQSGEGDVSCPYISGKVSYARPMTRRQYESLNGNVCDAEDEDGYEVETSEGCTWMSKGGVLMRLTAKPLADGTVEFYAGGKKVDGMRCKAHSARISEGQVEATAYVTCDRWAETPVVKTKKEKADVAEHSDPADMDA